jgi:uncharacterized protein with HEPN domain
MPPEDRDPAYLWDMLEAAREVQRFVAAVRLEEYMQDPMRQRAIERTIEILGEAAHHVSETFKTAHPEIPWHSIIGQRNVLAHEYGRIDHARIWTVATVHIPDLIVTLEPLIPPLPPEVAG